MTMQISKTDEQLHRKEPLWQSYDWNSFELRWMQCDAMQIIGITLEKLIENRQVMGTLSLSHSLSLYVDIADMTNVLI